MEAGKWLFACVVPASAMAIGAIPAGALVVVAMLAAAACALLWFGDGVALSSRERAFMLAIAVLGLATAIQLVSLPSGLVHVLSPAVADIWSRALLPIHEQGPAHHPLTLAPWQTRVELLRVTLYASVFLGAARIRAVEGGDRFLVRLVVGSSCAMALVSLAHAALSAETIFGLYRPREIWAYQDGRYSPLLNTNHLAAYLNVGACVAFASILSGGAMPRPLAVGATLLCASVSVWQSSRAGTATLLLGIVLASVLTLSVQRRIDETKLARLFVSLAGLVALLLVIVSLAEGSAHLVSRDLIKLEIARRSLKLIAVSPWFGMGRGSFETVYPQVHEGESFETFTNPEDIFVQWLVEWGIIVSLVAMALFAWALRPAALLRGVRPRIGPWVAVVVAVAHDLADYHLEVPGIVVLVLVCSALAVGGTSRARPRASRVVEPWRRVALGVSAVSVAVAAMAAMDLGHSLADERRSLAAMAASPAVSRGRFVAAARDAMRRYPAESFFPLMGAARMHMLGEGSVVPWVARALERNPRLGRAHLLLAESLARSGPAQARLEYRLAYTFDRSLHDVVVERAARLVGDVPSAMEIVPDGQLGIEVLESLSSALATRLPATASALDAEILRRDSGAVGPSRRRADAAVADVASSAPWCVPMAECTRDARAKVDEAIAREPRACASHERLARLRLLTGGEEGARAFDAFTNAAEVVDDRSACQRRVVSLALEVGDRRRADRALEALLRGGCGAVSECVELYGWAARTEEGRGRGRIAVGLYRRARTLAPERDDLLIKTARLAEQQEMFAEAIDAYEALRARQPANDEWPKHLTEVRRRAIAATTGSENLPTTEP